MKCTTLWSSFRAYGLSLAFDMLFSGEIKYMVVDYTPVHVTGTNINTCTPHSLSKLSVARITCTYQSKVDTCTASCAALSVAYEVQGTEVHLGYHLVLEVDIVRQTCMYCICEVSPCTGLHLYWNDLLGPLRGMSMPFTMSMCHTQCFLFERMDYH